MLRRMFPRYRPSNWQMNRGVEIPNFPLGPENTYFIPGKMPDPSRLASLGPTYPSAHAPERRPEHTQLEPPPEVQQFQPQPQVRVELIRVYDEPDPASVEAQPPVEPTPQPAAAIAEPTVQPVPSEPPPKHKKKYKKRPRRKARRNIEEEFALVQKGVLTPVGHHERLCQVCRNDFRENIEEEFTHWHNVHDIAAHYGIEPRTIYRHAKALNLYDERDRNLRFALGHIIHRAQSVRITADALVRAVHHFARISRDGRWVDPPTHVVVSPGSRVEVPPPDPLPADAIDVTPSSEELPTLIDAKGRVEHDPTD
ncbi:MAG TPA: hypothetical protein VN788_14190 [Verrucomicrobiae bacterium]|nr:hypothetical protein [Verrucomicrobiae bacterium]